MDMMHEIIKNNILHDFEHCGEIDSCENCKAYETFNGTDCTFCELLRGYKTDIVNALNKLIDDM